ncbi:MAG: hypothetical protein ACFHX7_12360 [Pseudomonadota bacterium]
MLLALPVAVFSGNYADWAWYWKIAGLLVLAWASLAAGTWSAKKYGVRKLNGWFLRAWIRKALLLALLVLGAANVFIRGETSRWFVEVVHTEDVRVVDVPNCSEGIAADMEYYIGLSNEQNLARLRDRPSVLVPERLNKLGCEGDLTQEQLDAIQSLDGKFDTAVNALNAAEQQERQDELDRQAALQAAAPATPPSFDISDYTELNFEVPANEAPTLDDIHNVIDDSRGEVVPGLDRRTVYRKQKYHAVFPTFLFGPLGAIFSGGLTRTEVVEKVVAGAAHDGFDVQDAIASLTPLFDGLSFDEQMRLKDLIAAELEVAVMEGKMSADDANTIFGEISAITVTAAANDAEASIIRDAEALCAGMLDGREPSEEAKARLGNPRLVQYVGQCINTAALPGAKKTELLTKLNEWGGP